MVALYEAGYQGVRKGQLVIHAMDAFAGAVGVSDSDGKCTPEYVVCFPRAKDALPKYFALALRLAAYTGFILVSCPAVRERAPRFRYPNFGDMQLPVPPPSEQAAIVRFIDHVDDQIRLYIRLKQRQIKLLEEQTQIITDGALKMVGTRSMRLGFAVDKIERPINRQSHHIYTPIGLYNRGRGIFHKPLTKGADLGDSSFFLIEEGDLILSGQFAWEGAIALAGPEDEGCIASHRYPILRGKPNLVESAYLLAFFKTGWGQLLLDYHSRGAAGRNRPLNASNLLKEKIPIPPLSEQTQITKLIHAESKLRKEVAGLVAILREYRTRVIADVVTGKLDVRDAAAALPDVEADEESFALDDLADEAADGEEFSDLAGEADED